MELPDYQKCMLPLLEFSGDGKEHSLREALEAVAKKLEVSEEQRSILLPSGQQPLFDNRVGWARTYLKKAGLIQSPRRGVFQITENGKNLLRKNPGSITINLLKNYDEFVEFWSPSKKIGIQDSLDTQKKTPEEELENAYQTLREGLASDLLSQIKQSPPALFEKLVVEMLVKMGYGGTRQDAGRAIGKSGDEGIDGIIKEDRLGLDIIYIQAKRWEGTVGRPEIQKFAGALQGQRARKGIFITTSDFSREASDYALRIESKIILINGTELAEMLIDHNVGVSPVANYQLKKIDLDYFIEQ
ncbi:MAG: restriction endonuclease [Verrucomicrobiales bacterium]